MILRRLRLTTVIAAVLTTCVWSGTASALDLSECEEEASPAIAPIAPKLILPCAVAERVLTATGDLACADANLYVVTHAGTLLCEVDIPALVASSSAVERAPQATLSASSAFSAAAPASHQSSLPPPLVIERRPAPVAVARAPLDGFARPPSVPS